MGQIIFNGQKPKYCNLSTVTTGSQKSYVIPNNEVWLIDSTNTSKPDGTGKYDYYVIGDGSKTAAQLVENKVKIDDPVDITGKQDTITTVSVNVGSGTGTPSGSASVSGNVFTLNLDNLKGAKGDKGDTGEQGPQGIQGVQGERGPVGANGVTTNATISIITGIDTTTQYDSTKDVASAEAVQDILKMLGTVYYVATI